jgi:hypothetical protein
VVGAPKLPIHVTPSPSAAAERILNVFDWLERWVGNGAFRGCPFVNAVAELGALTHAATKIALAYKEQRRLWFRDLLIELGAKDADMLATQIQILVDGAIATELVRGDPGAARAAKAAARVLLKAAGVREGEAVTSR